MQVDIRVPVGLPILQTADFIARCEDAGFDGVGVHDHPHSGRDVYVTLAIAAERTRIARLYPATSSPIVRHPLLLASVAHSLEEIAPGRICLTIAPGFLAARSIGRPRANLATMREAVVTVRRLLAGDTVRLRGDGHTPAQPLFTAHTGLPSRGRSAHDRARGRGRRRRRASRGPPSRRDRRGAPPPRGGRPPSGALARRAFAPSSSCRSRSRTAWQRHSDGCSDGSRPGQSFLTYPSASNLHWLRRAGIDLADDHVPEKIPDDLAARIADAFGLFGPPEHCLERLQRARTEAGVEHVFLFPAHTLEGGYEMPTREVDAFRRIIRARL